MILVLFDAKKQKKIKTDREMMDNLCAEHVSMAVNFLSKNIFKISYIVSPVLKVAYNM